MVTPDQLRKCATCVYLAAEAGPADDIANHLRQAADTIKELTTKLSQMEAYLAVITAHRDQFAEEVAMLWPRVNEAEELLKYVLSPAFYAKNRTQRDKPIQAFLAPTPEAEPTPPSKSIQRRVAIQSGGDCVVVRRDDLPYYLHFAQTTVRLGGYSPKEIEVIDRLKAALVQGREGE